MFRDDASAEPVKHLYGVHDWSETWAAWVRDAGVTAWCATTHARDERRYDFGPMAAQSVTPIARLNWSHHGQGTIPPDPAQDAAFAAWCAAFAADSLACRRFIVGNEPNWSAEWGGGPPITPGRYAECYRRVYDRIKAARPDASIMPAAVAPWNVEAGMGWIEYWREMLRLLAGQYDGLALHTYSRGYMPAAVADEDRMNAPWQQYRNGFRTYRDFLEAVPAGQRHKPCFITETNGNGVWPSDRSGWVQAAYAEIDGWNKTPGTQKIHALVLFRWPRFDVHWQFETKPGVHADFRDALARAYRAPDAADAGIEPPPAPEQGGYTLYLPAVSGSGAKKPPPSLPGREWDERLMQRGVAIEEAEPAGASAVWRVVEGRWLPPGTGEGFSNGLHHILVRVIDENGQALGGVPLRVRWPTGEAAVRSKARVEGAQGWNADYGMSASRNEFSIRVDDGLDGDTVTGIGMGADLGAGFNASEHSSTFLVFQRTALGEVKRDAPATAAPALIHPVAEPAYRLVSQGFGERPEVYKRFMVDGVPLLGHNGIDLAVPAGTRIRAAAAGRVLEAGDDPAGYGLYIKLGHGWGETLYAHLSEQQFAFGAAVEAGQVIALSGNTGFSSGPHLHFGLRVHPYDRRDGWGGYRDPAPYLGQASGGGGEAPSAAVDYGEVVALIRESATELGVDSLLLLSLCWKESSFNPLAVSSAGARGLGQIMAATWDEWSAKVAAEDISDPRDNARVAAAYLRWCIRTAGSERRGLWAYVWGIGRVLDLGKPGKALQPPPEVMEYANTIIFGRDLLKAIGLREHAPN